MWGALSRGTGLSVSDDDMMDDDELCAGDDSLGNASLMLLMCLSCYSPSTLPNKPNPYRQALANFLNAQGCCSINVIG